MVLKTQTSGPKFCDKKNVRSTQNTQPSRFQWREFSNNECSFWQKKKNVISSILFSTRNVMVQWLCLNSW